MTLIFAEIEALLGAPLPRTRDFWTNHRAVLRSTPQARAWQAAGWWVARVALRRLPPAVTFARPDSTP